MSQNLKRQKNNYLITGTSSGLGKYLYNNLGGICFKRQTSERVNKEIKGEIEVIIHCAFNSDRNPKDIDQYLKDNVSLTEQLTKIPHKKFIFISSVDVYPKDPVKHSEDENIDITKIDNLYGKTKLMSEGIVKKNCANFLILRCTGLLGKDSRKNSLIRILKDKKPSLTLNGESVFNYILHSDLLNFLVLAKKKDLKGIYNIASSKNITLFEIASWLKKKVKFGYYIYNVGNIDNTKTLAILPDLEKTSRDVVDEFVKHTLHPN